MEYGTKVRIKWGKTIYINNGEYESIGTVVRRNPDNKKLYDVETTYHDDAGTHKQELVFLENELEKLH